MLFYFIYFWGAGGGKCLFSAEVSLYDLLRGDRNTHALHSTARDLVLSLAQPCFQYFLLSDYFQSGAHLMSVHVSSVYTFPAAPALASLFRINSRQCLGPYLEKEKKKCAGGNYGSVCNSWTRQQRRGIGAAWRNYKLNGSSRIGSSRCKGASFQIKEKLTPLQQITARIKGRDLTFEGIHPI